MILTIETAAALNKLLKGEDAQTPNGETPHWQVEVVEAVRQSEPGKRMTVYKDLLGARADWMTISNEVMAADAAKPKKTITVTMPTNGDGERLPEKLYKSWHYISVYTQLGYSFQLCDLDDRVEVNSAPLSDPLESEMKTALRDQGLFRVEVARDAYITEAAKNRYHPIHQYFKALQWDGADHISRLASYFKDVHGAFPLVLRLFLVGAVAKALNADRTRMLILDGPQNIGKSSFARWLCSPLPKYFYEGAINPDANDHKIRLMRTFIWEVSELGSTMRRQDIEALKAFLTQRQVTARLPYAHHDVVKPAMASFIGTVNNIGGILADPTGNSRFLTINLIGIDWEGYTTNCNVNQVWAQAVALYRKGERWEPKAEQLELVTAINDAYEVQDPIEDLIQKYFYIDPEKEDWFTPTLDVIQVLHENGWRGNTPRAEAMLIAPSLRKLGLRNERRWHLKANLKGYAGLIRKSLLQ
jgi:predicted P-loop ATPase